MPEVSDEAFQHLFEEMGYHIEVDEVDVFNKLRELCITYRYEPDMICSEWVAYVKNKKVELKVTTEHLDQMERESLRGKAKASKPSTKASTSMVHTISTIQDLDDEDDDFEADDLLGTYSTPNNKSQKRQITPDARHNKRLTNVSRSPVVPFSPSSFSPVIATPSQKYSSRKNSGEVVTRFGEYKDVYWKSSRNVLCQIKPHESGTSLSDRFKYMFQKMADKACVLNDMIEDMGEFLQSKYDAMEFAHVAIPTQETVPLCGRICCDSNGKLNAQSVVLEGSRETSAGKRIPLDISGVSQYSLFPGQIVALEGMNSTGNKLVVKKVYENLPLPSANSDGILKNGPLRVVIAAGPYTTSDGIGYDPLRDLMTYIHNTAPDLCIMLGPFIDAKNPDIQILFENVSFDDFFEENIVRNIEALSRHTNTQIVLVPSQRDAHADYVYPQPPYKLPEREAWNKIPQHKDVKRIHCVSDPCTLDVDGVIFGITSTDILFHLGAEEISNNAGPSDRLSRLTKHILTQHSYYPLYPSSEEVNIDYELFEQYAKLPVTPHVLVIPSELRYFVKDIMGCCCVNPGRLAKGQVGGTFSRLLINPPTPQEAGKPDNYIAAEIVRI